MTQVKLHYSEALVRQAVRSFWWRSTGWLYVLAMLLLLFSFCSALWSGDRSWWVGVSGTVLTLGIIFAVALYFVHYRATLTRFRRMRQPEATFELGDERFRISSDVGTSELAWGTITEVWRFPDFWLLFLSRAQFITLPAADLDTNAREFILAKAGSSGAKVV
jgi:hypothetical protein